MPSIPNPFAIAAKAVRAFFKADLKLRRGQRGFELVLDTRSSPDLPAADGPASTMPPKLDRELRCMRQSLAALLDEQAENRRVLRHLAFIEHALERVGMRAFDKVPFDVLKRAHAQLDGLVTNWSDEGLATLRSKMAVALIEREPPRAEPAVAAGGAPDSTVDAAAPLAHPETLEGDEAAEAEAALLAAYGSVALPGLTLTEITVDAAPAREAQSATS